ncbi:UNKNOWN [Stylonychia lemnae]|uniref:Uncharacterized protein n=1 Tax=Stylonychia lemnae TaxID=5949 RepID=A0A077ZMT1_STYLE|nr:UNKNOWN [Stylonychia lemnae]|eukprot:CDW71238.1 UNKNOWN [Stylonychia lemnae]
MTKATINNLLIIMKERIYQAYPAQFRIGQIKKNRMQIEITESKLQVIRKRVLL